LKIKYKMVYDGYVRKPKYRGYDSTRGVEEKGAYERINPTFPSIILRTHLA
jgi:hypothetical protein